MADTATKKRRPRAPSPEDLGFESAPERAPTPEKLWSNISVDELPDEEEGEAPVPPLYSPPPEEIGLSFRPPPSVSLPDDASWQDFWDWSSRQIEDASGTVMAWGDDIRETLGFDEPSKPFPQDTSRRVPREDMTEDSGIVDTITDWLVPDPVYDFVTSDRAWKNLGVGADDTIAGLVVPLLKGGAKGAKIADRWLDEAGIDLDYWQRSDQEKEVFWQDTMAWLDGQKEFFGKRAEENRRPEGERTVFDALTETLPMIPVMVAEYAAAGAAFGPIAGFAVIDAVTAWGDDETADGVLWAGMKGAAMGQFLEWANVLSRPLRAVVLAPAGGGLAWAEGASDVDIMASSIVFPILGLLPKSGPISARYLRENGIKPDLRDVGGHVRDLFVGGNEPTARRNVETTDRALKQVRSKHTVESTEESLRWQSELTEARKPQPGDTETSVNERVAEANRGHDARMEEYSSRHYNEEIPHRQANDHAKRRHDRARTPFRVSWMEAPYMRSLHMFERDVVVANVDGVRVLQKAQEDGDARLKDGLDRAAEIRKQAEEEPDPVKRRGLNQLADHVEDTTLRMVYEMRSGAEDVIEFRVELAEARATAARFELAEIIGRRNPIDGRRAMQLATDRELADAYRAGLRKITRSNRRARELLRKGDDVVTRRKSQLERDGIREDNPETKEIYNQEMTKAEEIRDAYRETASFELYEGQSSADFRVSFAIAAKDAAYNPKVKPGLFDNIKEMLGIKRKKSQEEETTPDDAKKPDAPDWDRPIHDPVAPAPNFEQRYKSLLEHAQKDPELGRIQNEVDHILRSVTDETQVFPAINRIAKQREYDAPSRRGKQTKKLREEAAQRLGMTSEEFLNSPYGKAFSDFELEAIIMILDRQWARTQRSYEIWRKTGSQQAFMQYQAELYRFMMIWERVRGAAAEAGRSLRMFREIGAKYGRVGKPMTDLEYQMMMAGDGAQAGRLMAARARGGFFDMLIEYYINGLLSGPQTAVVNILSGINMVAWKGILQPTIAATVGLTRYAFHATVGKFLYKPFRAVYRTLIRMFGSQKSKNELAVRTQNEKWMVHGTDIMNAHAHRVRFGEVGARVRGMLEGFFLAVPQFFKTLFLGDRFLGEATYGKGMGEHIPWWMGGGIIRIPGKILQAIDDFFKVIMYRSALRGHAYRLAMAEYNYSSQGWKELRGRRTRYQELVKRPESQIKHLAKREALEATFQNPMAPEWAGVPAAVQNTPFLKILVPFTRTLLNSLEFVLSGTPAYLLFRNARDALHGRRGRAQQDMAIAHMILVTGSASLIFLWALGDNVAPPYPKDEKGRTIQGINDVPPLSVRIPGTEEWIQLNRIDPIGAIISLGASSANAYKYATARGDDKGAEKAWAIFVSSMFSMVTDRAGFKGLLDFFQAFQGGASGQDSGSWTRWANKTMATIAVPQVIATWARTKDPVIRRAETLLDHINSRTPGEREKLPPIRNVFGDMVVGYDSYGDNDFLDYTMPVYWGRKSKDPAANLLLTLFKIYDWAPGQLDRSIAGRELTPEEYDYYQVQAGKHSYAGLRELEKSPEWKRAQQLQDDARRALKMMRVRGPNAEKGMERTWLPDWFNRFMVMPANLSPAEMKQYKAAKKVFFAKITELSRLRYNLLQKSKKIVSAARKKARYETAGNSDQSIPGKFPGIWKRKKKKDDAANTGMEPTFLPDWFEQWMEGETPQDDWLAEEAKNAEEHGTSKAPEDATPWDLTD